LRQLDAATALAQTEMLLSAVRLNALPEERRISSGFVEQQQLFARAQVNPILGPAIQES
jgi:hypothetical protein